MTITIITLHNNNTNNNYKYEYKIKAQDCSILTGITMMMIVLLMKVCIESSRDNIFCLLLFSAWVTTEGILSQQH